MDMGLVNMLSNVQQVNFQQEVGTRVLKMAMDNQSSTGAQVVDLIDNLEESLPVATDPNLGLNFDVSI